MNDRATAKGGKYIKVKDESVLEDAMNKVNDVKMILDSLTYALEEAGYTRKANSLNTIIGKLENWQNTK